MLTGMTKICMCGDVILTYLEYVNGKKKEVSVLLAYKTSFYFTFRSDLFRVNTNLLKITKISAPRLKSIKFI